MMKTLLSNQALKMNVFLFQKREDNVYFYDSTSMKEVIIKWYQKSTRNHCKRKKTHLSKF